MILGGNPFSGFSHQNPAQDHAMRHWYTVARIKDALRRAEAAGITTHISRADHHVMRYLMEYWDEGGKLTWAAQTCPEVGSVMRGVENAIAGGAKACHLHGGMMDHLLAQGRLEEVPGAIARLREAGLATGIAGHDPRVFEWAEKNVNVDYYMCSYYNPQPRQARAEHVHGMTEDFNARDRQVMTRLIRQLPKPVIHYKVMAAGRNDPREALEFVARHLRPQDAVCVGVWTKDFPDSIAEDVRLLDEALAKAGR
jgi:hypothetical protein